MKYVKIIVVLLISIFLLSSILFNATATAQSDGTKPTRLIDKILMGIFKYSYSKGPIAGLLFPNIGTPWKVFRFSEPDFFTADPNIMDLENLNHAEIIIGIKDSSTGEYKSLKDYSKAPFETAKDFTFKLEIPNDVPEGALITKFSPPMLVVGEGGEVKTKLTIDLNIPEDTVLPDKIILRVNITRYTTYGNLWTAFGIPVSILALLSPNPWPTFSGKRLPDDPVYIDILVKTNRFHLADIIPPQNLEMRPNELQSIPIEIRNLGSHTDTFNFRTSTNTDDGMIVSPPLAITLKPNEVGHTSISIATPRQMRDPGTVRSINIEAYSIYEPDKIFRQTATITTKGVYVSEISWMYYALFGIIILFAVVYILRRRKKILAKIGKKPEKPWDISGKKEYLEKLKKEDRKKYNVVLNEMKDEYKSSILSYKSYRKTMLKEARKKSLKRFTDIFKRSKREKKVKAKKLEKKKQQISDITKAEEIKTKESKPESIEEEMIKSVTDKSAEMEKQRREQAILKIKKAQEKQRRKFGKFNY